MIIATVRAAALVTALALLPTSCAHLTAQQKAHTTLTAVKAGVETAWNLWLPAIEERCTNLAQACASEGRDNLTTCPEVKRCVDLMSATKVTAASVLTLVKEAAIQLELGNAPRAEQIILRAVDALARLRVEYDKLKSELDAIGRGLKI